MYLNDAKTNSEKQVIIDEIYKPSRKHFKRRQFIQRGINDTLQMDLVEMIPYARFNKGYKYLLTVIDCFSKKAFTRPLKSKTGKEVTVAVKSVLAEIGSPPKNIHTDQGKEFFNSHFKSLMREYGINHYNTYTHMKASIVERFNRTLKTRMWKVFGLQGNYNWIVVLSDLMKNYNNSYHRTIKMSPTSVNETNEQHLLSQIYNNQISSNKNKFKIGDKVRISKYKGVFAKGYEPNWSTEIFRIFKIQAMNPIIYLLKDYQNIPIKGGFYEAELQKVKHPDLYLIEKIIKEKDGMLLVKYLGFDNSHNTWINKNDILV